MKKDKYLPRRKLIGNFHILHDFLQCLFIPDIHLITNLALPIPVVNHDGQMPTRVETLPAPKLGGCVLGVEPSDPGKPSCGEGRKKRVERPENTLRRLLSLLYTVARTVNCAARNAVVCKRNKVWRRRGRSCATFRPSVIT